MPNVPIPSVPLVSLASLGRAIETLEIALLRGRVQATARRNAWSAVCADRERAQDRREAERVLAALSGGGPSDAAEGGSASSVAARVEPRT